MFIKTKRVKLAVGLSIITILLLSLAHTIQGARVINSYASGTTATYRVTFEFNDNLDETKTPRTSVQPARNTTTRIQGNTLTVSFDEPILYDSNFEVRVDNVIDARGKITKAEYSFSTSPQTVTFLRRNVDSNDQIIRKQVGVNEEKVLFEHEKISTYALGKRNTLFIITEADSTRLNTTLHLVENETSRTIDLPYGIPTAVYTTSRSDRLIIQAREPSTLDMRLYSYDVKRNTFDELKKPDGSSIHVSELTFGSDQETVIYQDAATAVVVVDNFFDDRPLLSYGTAAQLVRYLPNDKGIFIESNPSEYGIIDQKGKLQPIETPPYLSGSSMLLNNDIVTLQNIYPSTAEPYQDLSISSNDQLDSLLTQPIKTGLLSHITINSSDEFISVEKSPQPAQYDNYLLFPKALNTQLLLLDIESKTVLDTIEGSQIQWL